MDAVIFGAHPDDVELSSGGLVAVLAGHGHGVHIVDLTRGEAASRGTVEQRAVEAQHAATILGASRENLGLPDTGINRSDASQLRAVVGCLRTQRPRLVIAPDEEDAHPDHVEASHLVSRACYLSGLANFDAPGERYRPARLLYALYRSARPAHLVVDVSAVWAQRTTAIEAHVSQLAGPEGPETYLTAPGFLDEVAARARSLGALIGVAYGEGYRTRGPLAVTDARALLMPGRTP
jgi:bacillithiol biosynthesis deacetylase BshB1